MGDDGSKKKFSFPSFKSAAKVAAAAPACQDVAVPKPAPVRETPVIVTKPHKYIPLELVHLNFNRRPVKASGGRSGTELKRIREETVFDIDHRGDMEIFRYGGIDESKVPLYHGRKVGRVEEYEPVPLRRIYSEPIEEPSFRIKTSELRQLDEFVPVPEEDDECVIESSPAISLDRQKELNEALGRDPKNIHLWVQLLDLQDGLGHKALRSAVLERKLAIIDRALKESGREGEYWRLRVYEMKCRGELESYESMNARWTDLLSGRHDKQAGLALWKAYLDWLQSDCGLSKFSVSECLEAYSQAFRAMDYEVDFESFQRYCHFLKDIDHMERLSALLAMVFKHHFANDSFGVEEAVKRSRPKRPSQLYQHDPSQPPAMNWTMLESSSRKMFWFPRPLDFDPDDDPLEPLEDYMREVLPEDMEPIRIVSWPGLVDALVRLASDLLEVKGLICSDYQFHFADDHDVVPESFTILCDEPQYPSDRRAFLNTLHRMEPEFHEAVHLIQAINPFSQDLDGEDARGHMRCWLNLAPHQEHQTTSELETIYSWHQAHGTTHHLCPTKGSRIGPLAVALFLKTKSHHPPALRRWADEEYREMVYDWLRVDPGSEALIMLAWRMDGHMRFRSKFRRWLESLDEESARKVWPVVIGLEEPACDPNKFSSLCETALRLIRTDRKSIWSSYLRNGQREPVAYKAVVYRAIADCPYCKDLYMTAIQEGLKRKALEEHEAEELVHLMEEKGIRLRHLIEEATL